MAAWRTPEELVTIGFAKAPIVMMNEGHNGLYRCVRTRRTGAAILPAAHEAGCRTIAMEALGAFPGGYQVLDGPPDRVGYLAQPEMGELVDAALALGWRFIAYEADHDLLPRVMLDKRREVEESNWRERMQAQAILHAHKAFDQVLVWCGNAHHRKQRGRDWIPMGVHVAERARAYSIDQLGTVSLGPENPPAFELTPELIEQLDALGGTAGFTRDEPVDGMTVVDGYDAVILSTDNDVL